MRTRFRILAATGLLLTLGLSGSSVARAQELSGDAQRVVDFLLDDWENQFRSTSIPLAMDNLEMAPDDALRLEKILPLIKTSAPKIRQVFFFGNCPLDDPMILAFDSLLSATATTTQDRVAAAVFLQAYLDGMR